MKMDRLKLLTPFRGLPAGYEVHFNSSNPFMSTGINPICFVGLNGSGKSNVLEVIAEIFYYMETYNRAPKDRLESFATSFGFEIEYELPNQYIQSVRPAWDELNLHLSKTVSNPKIKLAKQIHKNPQISIQLDDLFLVLKKTDINQMDMLLPSRIVAYSSGMNELLSNPFIKRNFSYYDDFKSKSGIDSLSMNRMFFLDYDSNKFIAICNFMFDAEHYGIDPEEQDRRAISLGMEPFGKDMKATHFGGVNLNMIKSALRIQSLHSFVIHLKLKKSKNDKEYLHPTLSLDLDALKKCATFVNEQKRETKNDDFLNVELVFWVNAATKEAFRHYFKTPYELFQSLYFFQLLNNELISQETRKVIMTAKTGAYENLSDELPRHEASNLIFRISGITFCKEDNTHMHYT